MFSGSAYNSGPRRRSTRTFSWQAGCAGQQHGPRLGQPGACWPAAAAATRRLRGCRSRQGRDQLRREPDVPAGRGGGTIHRHHHLEPADRVGHERFGGLGLNTACCCPRLPPPLETTFNTIYPQLGAQNSFTNNNAFSGTISSQGTIDLVSPGVTSSSRPFELRAAGIERQWRYSNARLPEALNFGWLSVATAAIRVRPARTWSCLYGFGLGPTGGPQGCPSHPSGIINFCQRTRPFPAAGGGITGITTSSPLAGSGTSGSVALGLNETTLISDITPTLETTLNSVYAQLGTVTALRAADLSPRSSRLSRPQAAGVITYRTGGRLRGIFSSTNTTASSAVYAEDDATGNPGLGIALKGMFRMHLQSGCSVKSAGAKTPTASSGRTWAESDSFGVYASASGPGSTAIYGGSNREEPMATALPAAAVVGISSSGMASREQPWLEQYRLRC